MAYYSFEKLAESSFYKRFKARKRKSDFRRKLNHDDLVALLENLSIVDEDAIPKLLDNKLSETDKKNKDATLRSYLSKMNSHESQLLQTFYKNNIRNILWYELKIKQENAYRLLYATVTAIFVFGVPIVIGYVTFFAKDLDYSATEFIGTSLTVLLASIIGVHKMISSWMEKRKYRSHFFQAKTDLQDILFALVERFNELVVIDDEIETQQSEGSPIGTDNSDTQVTEATHKPAKSAVKLNYTLSGEMIDELENAINESRKIVRKETKAFFEMSATTTFDLGNILTQSGETAKNIVSTFRSHSYDLDKKKEAAEKAKADKSKAHEAQLNREIGLKTISIKLERLSQKEMVLLEKWQKLQDAELNAEQKTELKEIEKQIDLVQGEIESLEIEFMKHQILAPEQETESE